MRGRENSEGGILWGREGFERSRRQQRAKESYRRELQEQILRNNKRMRAKETNLKLPNLRDSRASHPVPTSRGELETSKQTKITQRRRRATPQYDERSDDNVVPRKPEQGARTNAERRSNANARTLSSEIVRDEKKDEHVNVLMRQIARRNAASIASVLARVRRTEEDILRMRRDISVKPDGSDEENVRLMSLFQKLEQIEGREEKARRVRSAEKEAMQAEITTLKVALESERRSNAKERSEMQRRIELLEGRDRTQADARRAVGDNTIVFAEMTKRIRSELGQRIDAVAQSFQDAEARLRNDAKRRHEEVRSGNTAIAQLREDMRRVQTQLGEALSEARTAAKRTKQVASSEQTFRQGIDRLNADEQMRATETLLRDLKESLRRESQEWRKSVASLDAKVERTHRTTVEGIKRSSAVSAENALRLQEQLGEAVGSVAKAVANGRKSAGDEWSEWESATARALETLRNMLLSARAETDSRFRALEDVVRAEVSCRTEEIEAMRETLKADREDIASKADEMQRDLGEWKKAREGETQRACERVKESIASHGRAVVEYGERLESLRKDASNLQEAARVFRMGQSALEEHQERVIGERIAKEIEECEKRCAADVTAKLVATTKAHRSLVSETALKFSTNAAETAQRMVRESNVVCLHKLKLAIDEIRSACEKARDTMAEAARVETTRAIARVVTTTDAKFEGEIQRLDDALRLLSSKASDDIDRCTVALDKRILEASSRVLRDVHSMRDALRAEQTNNVREIEIRLSSAAKERRATETSIRDLKGRIAASRSECVVECAKELAKERNIRAEETKQMGRLISKQMEHQIRAVQIALRSKLNHEMSLRDAATQDSRTQMLERVDRSTNEVRGEQRVLAETVAMRLQSIWTDMLEKLHEEKAARLRGDATLRAKIISQRRITNDLSLSSETQTRHVQGIVNLANEALGETKKRLRRINDAAEVRDVLKSMVDRVADESVSKEMDRRVCTDSFDVFRRRFVSAERSRQRARRDREKEATVLLCSGIVRDVVDAAANDCEIAALKREVAAVKDDARCDADVRDTLRSVVNQVADDAARVESESRARRMMASFREAMDRASAARDAEEIAQIRESISGLERRRADVSGALARADPETHKPEATAIEEHGTRA